MNKLRLHGFNNLTKSLSLNIYDLCHTGTAEQKTAYIAHVDEMYNAERLTAILNRVAGIIDATVLNIAQQDYEPQGASASLLIAEHPGYETAGVAPQTVLGHLDKSHITVHTYPECHPDSDISTFRADVDVSTCGLISPLKALEHLFRSFDADVATIDYRIRGFTRDVDGIKHFIDHEIDSIQQYVPEAIGSRYQMIDVNMPAERIFHTKMRRTELPLDRHLLGGQAAELGDAEALDRAARLESEVTDIFHGGSRAVAPT